MPLIIKVGVSRKVSHDYQSQGFNLDIQSELDPRILDDTDQLADATNHLFALANDLLDHQVEQATANVRPGDLRHPAGQNGASSRNGGQPFSRSGGTNNGRQANTGTTSHPSNGNGHPKGRNGGPKGNGGGAERPITSAQVNAIRRLAEKFDTSGDAVAREDYDTDLANLTLRQASDLIDRMKKSLEAQDQGAGQ